MRYYLRPPAFALLVLTAVATPLVAQTAIVISTNTSMTQPGAVNGLAKLVVTNGATLSVFDAGRYYPEEFFIGGDAAAAGAGSVILSGSGKVQVTKFNYGDTYIAAAAGSSGHLTVSGGTGDANNQAGSFLLSRVYVGDSGSGSILIQDGGLVQGYGGRLGLNATGSGTVTITRPNSTLSLTNAVEIGNAGSGTVVVQDGGRLLTYSVQIASKTGSRGSVTVTGNGSGWTNAVGGINTGDGAGTITVADGAQITSANGNDVLNMPNATVNIGAPAGNGAVGAGVLNISEVQGGPASRISTLQFNTTASAAAPYHFTRDGTSTGLPIQLTGDGLNVVQTAGYTVLYGTKNTSYLGSTTVRGGTLALGVAGAIGTNSPIVLEGGTLALNGFSPSDFFHRPLTVNANSTINFGGGNLTLAFVSSSGVAWNGKLTLTNFTVGSDRLGFASASGLTATQLGQISLAGYTATGLDSNGYVQFAVLAAPAITTQPASQTALTGGAANFTVVATGTAPLTYQWSKDGTAISGATAASYAIAAVQSADAGTYTVVIANSVGSVTSTAATLTVVTAPAITTQPTAQTVIAGSAATFAVVATGTGPLSYQWSKNGTAIGGATAASYAIAAVQAADAGTYMVVVTNSAGSVTSSGATLTVTPAPTAPAITTQPAMQTVVTGSAVTFTVAATGSAPLTYQWSKNGSPISGATAASYAIAATQSADAGTYTVVVTNSVGSATSSAATLTVTAAPTAPIISTEPVALTVVAGSPATFTVTATGTAPLSYQWNRNGVAIGGANAASFTLASAQSPDAGNYSVVVSNATGSATSATVTLTVTAAPTAPAITTQPVSLTIIEGGSATFSVVASGTAPLSYQWSKSGVAISGATAATYAINPARATDAGSYTVVVSNAVSSVTSNAVTLSVTPAVAAPVIATQPATQTVVAGAAVSFTVSATGTAPLAYQWSKNGAAISGATASSYTIAAAQAGDAGSYTVAVINSAGSVTSSAATLTVTPALTSPTITTQPVALSMTTGSTATFSVVAGGTSPLSYQWSKNGAAISGATASSYTISTAQASDVGSYTVVVSNSVGSVTSSVATLTVTAAPTAPTITTQPAAQTSNGNPVTFTVVASGTAPFTYQWSKNGGLLPSATSSTYTIPAPSLSDAGTYTVTVSNSVGSVTSSAAVLTVTASFSITTQPVGIVVNEGQNATFTVGVSGQGPFNYRWRKDGEEITGASGATLRLANVKATQAGSYSVVVYDASWILTSSSANLSVNTPLSITAQPASRTAAIGERVTLNVNASAASGVTLSYQWRKDGVSLSGQTGSSLTLGNLTASDFGAYSVLVTSSAGSLVSNSAELSVAGTAATAPAISRQPRGVSINPGSSLVLSVGAAGSPAPGYQWLFGGVPIAGANGATLVLTDVVASQAGVYSVAVSNSAGSVTSTPATVTLADGFGRQLNLSTLGFVGTGGDILIPGFVVAGAGNKRVLIRAAGPALAAFGVGGFLPDPQLAVFSGSTQILSNDNWSADPANAAAVLTAGASVGAFALTDSSKDAALVTSLAPGGYSIQVSGVGGTTGQAIVEVYDLDAADPARSRLVNLATRALVAAGAGPLISGFVVQGAVAKTVLVRATGPALAAFNVPGTLARPKLTLFNNNGVAVAENVGWESAGISDSIIAASQSVGAFPLPRGTADSALLAVLPPGNYTAQVVGADGGSGVALVEVYELP